MNYYEARQYNDERQPEKKGRFDYTCKNDDRVWPVGYCAGWQEPNPEELVVRFGDHAAKQIVEDYERRKQFKHKYHANGHATAEEAYECYRQYVLDNQLKLDLKMTDQQQRCLECNEWTQGLAEVGHGSILVLCEEHRNRAVVEKHFKMGPIISSY